MARPVLPNNHNQYGFHRNPTLRLQEDFSSRRSSPLPHLGNLFRRLPLHELVLDALRPSAESHPTRSSPNLRVRRPTTFVCRLPVIGWKICAGFRTDSSRSVCSQSDDQLAGASLGTGRRSFVCSALHTYSGSQVIRGVIHVISNGSVHELSEICSAAVSSGHAVRSARTKRKSPAAIGS